MNLEDFAPTASWANLQLRAQILRQLRTFFEERGFLEIETPLLSADTVVDRHLDPIAVTLPDDPRNPSRGRKLWLQTSPEFCMKRLLAAGANAIFQITRAFRTAESGDLHNPEFTIVEWYRVGDDLGKGIQLLGELAESLLGKGFPELLSYGEAFERYAGVEPHEADALTLQHALAAHGVDALAAAGNDRDTCLDLLLVHCVEPNLGTDRPTILYDYPASQAALARVRDDDPPVAERFELYAHGVELANGYHELLDADELLRRNKAVNEQRVADGKLQLPEKSRLLAAMDHGLPACTGVALGFDRLVMVAAVATSIANVMAFPIDRA